MDKRNVFATRWGIIGVGAVIGILGLKDRFRVLREISPDT